MNEKASLCSKRLLCILGENSVSWLGCLKIDIVKVSKVIVTNNKNTIEKKNISLSFSLSCILSYLLYSFK